MFLLLSSLVATRFGVGDIWCKILMGVYMSGMFGVYVFAWVYLRFIGDTPWNYQCIYLEGSRMLFFLMMLSMMFSIPLVEGERK